MPDDVASPGWPRDFGQISRGRVTVAKHRDVVAFSVNYRRDLFTAEREREALIRPSVRTSGLSISRRGRGNYSRFPSRFRSLLLPPLLLPQRPSSRKIRSMNPPLIPSFRPGKSSGNYRRRRPSGRGRTFWQPSAEY